MFEGPLTYRIRWRWFIIIAAAVSPSSIPPLVSLLGVSLPSLLSFLLFLGGIGGAAIVSLVTLVSSSLNLKEEYGGGCAVYYLHRVKDETLWARLSSYPSSTYVANPAVEEKGGIIATCGIESQARCFLIIGPAKWGKSRGLMRLVDVIRQSHPHCSSRWRRMVGPFHPKLVVITRLSMFDTELHWIKDLREPVIFVCDDLQDATDDELKKLGQFFKDAIRPDERRMLLCAIRDEGEHRLPEVMRQFTWIKIGPKAIEQKKLEDWLTDLVDRTALDNDRTIGTESRQSIVAKTARGDFSPLDIVANIKEKRDDLLEQSSFSRQIDQTRFDQVKDDPEKTRVLCAVKLLKAIGYSPEVKMLGAIYVCLFGGNKWQSTLDAVEKAGWLTVMRGSGLYAAADSPYDVVEFPDHTFGTDQFHSFLTNESETKGFQCLMQTGDEIALALGLSGFYALQSEFGKATALYEKLTARHPRVYHLHYGLGLYREAQGKWVEAEEALVEATRLKPDDFGSWFCLGVARMRQEKWAEGEEAFVEATKLRPDDVLSWVSLGATRLKQEKWADAEEATLEATKLKPDNFVAWISLGTAQLKQEKWAEAEQALVEATKLKPDDFDAWAHLGMTRLKQEKSAEAAFRTAVEGDPQLAPAWYYLGIIHLRRGERVSACSAFMEALKHADAFEGLHEVVKKAVEETCSESVRPE